MTADSYEHKILRYWLSCIQYEEALSVRPKALKTFGIAKEKIDLRNPGEGREYFKISTKEVGRLLFGEQPEIACALDAEIGEFFESWLHRQYRRFRTDPEETKIMVTCPVVHLQGDELAGLFRFAVSLEFCYADGAPFIVPKPSARKDGKLPPPPDMVRMVRLPVNEGLPFFVDGRLLSQQLGMTDEEVDELFDSLQRLGRAGSEPKAAVFHLYSLLTNEKKTKTDLPKDLIEELAVEMKKRLGAFSANSSAYPLGIVFDAGRAKTTFHLQREIQKLLSRDLGTYPVLHSYLTNEALPTGTAESLGLFRSVNMSRSQKLAADQFLGSSFTTVQGPPGTGKTALIHHLAAHELVSRAAHFADCGEMQSDILVIASTNNRAVDNAVDPLSNHLPIDELPITLRAGNRQICKSVLADQLDRSIAWLVASTKNTSPAEKEAKLKESVHNFQISMRQLVKLIGPRLKAAKQGKKRSGLEQELKEIKQRLGNQPTEKFADLENLENAFGILDRLRKNLEKLSLETEGSASKKKKAKVAVFFRENIERMLPKASSALNRLRLSLKIELPPNVKRMNPEQALMTWEDAAEKSLDIVIPFTEDVRHRLEVGKKQKRISVLEKQIAAIKVRPMDQDDNEHIQALKHELFERAIKVRESYAIRHFERFFPVLREARAEVEDLASLRSFCRSRTNAFKTLSELFPVFGCTLLSMGNVFSDEPNTIRKLVIDEAGQCHPAYAVSAFMRCRQALVFGDVHQLTPIFGLSRQDEGRIAKNIFGKASLPELFRINDHSIGSVQAIAEKAAASRAALTDHFRCQREIIAISDALCDYALKIHTPRKSRADMAPILNHSVLFADIEGSQERQGGSWHNKRELEATVSLLIMLLDKGILPSEVALITPYRAQLFALRRALTKKGLPIEHSLEMIEMDEEGLPFEQQGIALGTVHRFQGGERSIVLFTSVATSTRSLPFLNDRVNLLNVAVSRAKEHLVTIGHKRTLLEGSRTRLLVNRAERMDLASLVPGILAR